MRKPLVAVISFPGNNCEVESLRAIKESDMDALFFRWNDDRSKLKNVDGYFIPGGFSYEDRGRSGMVAARDPLMQFLHEEAALGKAIIGNCNGAQILVESGLIPLDKGLAMSLARNAVKEDDHWRAPGFLSEWVWIKPSSSADRCATSGWTGTMHLPIAHGEGRFITTDPDVASELKKNSQIAFQYCTEEGVVSEDPAVTPNGSMMSIAGICNPAGNVVALMPHPERTPLGKPYFDSLRKWIEKGRSPITKHVWKESSWKLSDRAAHGTEIFIDTIIVNNEERTVEQAAGRLQPKLMLKQWKYFSLSNKKPEELLSDLAIFNPNKERAFIRQGSKVSRWSADEKKENPITESVFHGTLLLRKDLPETSSDESGICYMVQNVSDADLKKRALLEIFANPHASTLEGIS